MKNKKNIVFGTIAVMAMLISSCGQAGFDVTVKPTDVKDINIGALIGFGYIIKIETYVETGKYGMDLSQIVYDYTFNNRGSNSINVEVRLSLYGEATLTDNNKVTLFTANSGGYGTAGTSGAEKIWLTAIHEDSISNEGYGWTSLIGSPASPIAITGSAIIKNQKKISNNTIIDKILKQDGVWVVTYISPGGSLPGFGSYLDLTNQSIQATGSKATGYYPGIF